VAIPLRKGIVERERVLIAAEDSATADQLESVLADQMVTSIRTTITPDSTGLPTGDAIVVCGPKSAPVGEWLLDRDPCLGMIEDRDTELSYTFGNQPFSLAAISDYDGLTITSSTLFLGPHRWQTHEG
jgi:hypothetical protein